VVTIAEPVRRDWWFALALVVALPWSGYWWLFRVAFELEMNNDRLSWKTPLRTGTVSVDEIERVRPMWFGTNVEVVEFRGRRPLFVLVSPGFRSFTHALQRRRPGLPVRFGWQATVIDKVSWGYDGYEEYP
jgi:hypothetical protein